MSENVNKSPRLTRRIFKALIKSIFWLILLYFLPMFMLSFLGSTFPEAEQSLFSHFEQVFGTFAIVIIFFVIASELASGTIFQHIFEIGKAVILMVLIVLSLEGGIVELDLKDLHITANLTLYLIMFLAVNFVSLAKGVLQAINFLSEKEADGLPMLKT